MAKESFVVIGEETDDDGEVYTWLYVFKSLEHAKDFHAHACEKASHIHWKVFACDTMTLRTAKKNLADCLSSTT